METIEQSDNKYIMNYQCYIFSENRVLNQRKKDVFMHAGN